MFVAHGTSRIIARHRTSRQRVVPHHVLLQTGGDKAARGPAELIGQRATLQPVVEFTRTAIKPIDNMRRHQRYWSVNL